MMRWPLRRVWQELSGKADRAFVDLIIAQVDTVHAGVTAVRRGLDDGGPTSEVRAELRRVEHLGDEQRGQIVESMESALVTPLDREDVYRLSRSVDDVLDNLRDFAREWDLYGVEDAGLLVPLVDELLGALDRLRDAANQIVAEPAALSKGALHVKKSVNGVRRAYQEAVAELLTGDGPVTRDMLRQRELLRRLDVVALRLGEAADILADASIKRSH